MIVILDFGLANVGSVEKMLLKVGAQVKIAADRESILVADAVIIPGVGSFDAGMARLENLESYGVLNFVALQKKTPILGICLGMQLMTKASEEGTMAGLGWIDAQTVGIDSANCLVPNMGWRYVNPVGATGLFPVATKKERYYFVHSYHVKCNQQSDVLTVTDYGSNFVSSFMRDNIVGVQFHPEKSHMYGFSFLKRWLEYYSL
jgi:imidazole glycerol-phosphate synthase subunit HisH